MNMKINRLLLIVMFAFAGCDSLDQVIEIDLPEHTPVLVLNARVEANTDWNVFLSKSRSILDKDKFYDFGSNQENPFEDDVVKNAIILVKVNGLDYAALTHEANGVYNSTVSPPGPGSVVDFEVSAPGFETLKVSDTLPYSPTLVGEVISSEGRGEDFDLRVSFSFDDQTKEEKDYYAILVNAIQGDGTREGLGFRINGASRFDAGLDDAESDFYNVLVFGDDFIDGQKVDVNLDIRNHYSSYELEVRLAKVSEAFFRYRRTIDLQNGSDDNPFAEPVPIYSNVEGGLGVLSTSSSILLFSDLVNTVSPEDLIGLWFSENQLAWAPASSSDFIYSDQAEMTMTIVDLQNFSMTLKQPDPIWRDGETIDLEISGTWSFALDSMVLQIDESILQGSHHLRVEKFDRLYLNGLMEEVNGGRFSIGLVNGEVR